MSDVAKFVTWAQEAEAELVRVKAERDALEDEIERATNDYFDAVAERNEARARVNELEAEQDRLREEVSTLKASARTNAEWCDVAQAEAERLRDGITRHRVGRYAEMFSDPEEAIKDDIHSAGDEHDLAIWALIGDDELKETSP